MVTQHLPGAPRLRRVALRHVLGYYISPLPGLLHRRSYRYRLTVNGIAASLARARKAAQDPSSRLAGSGFRLRAQTPGKRLNFTKNRAHSVIPSVALILGQFRC